MHRSIGCRTASWLLFGVLSSAVAVEGSGLDLRLVDAAKIRDWRRIESLLAQPKPLDLNAADPTGATALHWAVHWDNVDAVKTLIRAGARVNVANDQGITPLMLACTNGSDAVVR